MTDKGDIEQQLEEALGKDDGFFIILGLPCPVCGEPIEHTENFEEVEVGFATNITGRLIFECPACETIWSSGIIVKDTDLDDLPDDIDGVNGIDIFS